jgi:hypothetical protein
MQQDPLPYNKDEIIKQLAKHSKSIREAAGVKQESMPTLQRIHDTFGSNGHVPYVRNEDIQQAHLELAYLRSAVTLAENSNEVACTIKIGPFDLGVCDNTKIIPVLLANINEIEKYLKGEHNMYE